MSDPGLLPGPDALHVVLVGEMGVGKTTVGEIVAELLGRELRDSDRWLERAAGRRGASIAAEHGVADLHGLEQVAFREMVHGAPAVIAAAASVVDDSWARGVLEQQLTVWLTAPPEIVEARCASGSHRRAVDPVERGKLMARRASWFEEVSRFAIDTGSHAPAAVAAEILARLGHDQP